jgi:hypothetical protein
MPHQCVRCSAFYDDGAAELLEGCPCGGKLFFYIRKEKLEKAKEVTIKLNKQQKEEIERDVLEIAGAEVNKEEPIVLDLETIRIVQPGKYELDLIHLFKKDPLIYKVGEGKYIIDLIKSFRKA